MTEQGNFQPVALSLVLTDQSNLDLQRQQMDAENTIKSEIWGPDWQKNLSKAYYQPPGRPDLSYGEVNEIENNHRSKWAELWSRAKTPSSKIMVPKMAWAWALRDLAPKLDDLTQALLKNYDLYLCRYSVQIVEAEQEKVDWIQLVLEEPNAVIFSLWPPETYESATTISAEAKLKGNIGLTKALEVVEVPVGGSAGVEVVWQKKWEWAKANIEASGKATSTAQWKLSRKSSAPFAGDREFYLTIQLPRDALIHDALAKMTVKINPKGLSRSYTYDVNSGAAVRMAHQVA